MSRAALYAVLGAAMLVAVLLAVVRHAAEPPPGSEPAPTSPSTSATTSTAGSSASASSAAAGSTGTGSAVPPAASSGVSAGVSSGASAGSGGLANLAPVHDLPAGLVRSVGSSGQSSAGPGVSAVGGARECEPRAGDAVAQAVASWSYAAPDRTDGGRPVEAQVTVTRWPGFGSDTQLFRLGQDGGSCRWLFPQERMAWPGHDSSSSWLSRGGDPRGTQVASAVMAIGDFVVAAVGVSADGELAASIATEMADRAATLLRGSGLATIR